MCPISFAFKRIHLSALRLYRRKIWDRISAALTPARIDMMRIVFEHQDAGAKGVAQTRIQELLDVDPSVVSRMLKRMREIGLVDVWANPKDLRCNMVGLTDLGEFMLERYFAEMGLTMEVEALMNLAWFGERGGDGRFRELRLRSYKFLNRVRIALRDAAPFVHPWTTKDIMTFYNYRDRRNPFQVPHVSALDKDDVDDQIASFFRMLGDPPKPA